MAIGTTQAAARLNDRLRRTVKARMAWLGTNQKALAQELGVSQAWVSYRLTGEVTINIDDLERIADALETDPEKLIAGSIAQTIRRPERPRRAAVRTIVPAGAGRLTGRVPSTRTATSPRANRIPVAA